MTIQVGGYVGARTCTGGPTVGAKNLISWHLATFGGRGAKNLGIYNCRTVRGGTTTSLHGEGRAADGGTPTSNTWSWAAADFLRLYSKELGLQCVIHNRKIWSASGGTGWRNYGGVAPHFDHWHAELTWAAANGGLTLAKINDLWARHSGTRSGGAAVANDGILERGDSGPSVEQLQRVLKAWYPRLGITVDGDFGPATEAAVKHFQKAAGLAADGVAGPNTLNALNLSGLR
jgi:hypothetical protein